MVKDWANTNQYLTGEAKAPDGITVFGGKTGTTNAAGHCLALYSENAAGVPYVSIIMRAPSRGDLYAHMAKLLEKE